MVLTKNWAFELLVLGISLLKLLHELVEDWIPMLVFHSWQVKQPILGRCPSQCSLAKILISVGWKEPSSRLISCASLQVTPLFVDKTISFGRWNHLNCCWNVQKISKPDLKNLTNSQCPIISHFLAKSPSRFTLHTPTPAHFADLAEGAPCRQMVLGRCSSMVYPYDPFKIFNLYYRYYRYHECCSYDGCDSLIFLIFAASSTLNHDFQLRWFRSLFLLLKSPGNW